ncbi:hypothetical protein [Stenotrophomonas maltophilia]|uniref:hypothetical protein n=1 Tax=Stenotrophomonas maltophilia TaxID=40324 RepID=UPI0013DB324F|nr:hypothetical protein [Stenotrophomonas maltophilia]
MINIRVDDAKLSLPARYSSGPALELKGTLEIAHRLVAGENEHDVTDYPVVVDVVAFSEPPKHQGMFWVDPDTKNIHVAINAAETTFDRLLTQLSNPATKKLVRLEVDGLGHTDDNGGTLHWRGKTVTTGYPIYSAEFTVQLASAS